MSTAHRIWVALMIAIALSSLWYVYERRDTALSSTPASSFPSTPVIASASTTNTSATSTKAQGPRVLIDGQTIDVTLATTQDQQTRGLGGRSGLSAHEGMLFVFPNDAQHMFWMKDMQFSIDMIWFSADEKVIYIQPNVSPDTYPAAFGPSASSRYVLEVPANFAATYHMQVGDQAVFSN